MLKKPKCIFYLVLLFYCLCTITTTVSASKNKKNTSLKKQAQLSSSNHSGQEIAAKIANLTNNAVYNLDTDQLFIILPPILEDSPAIKALSIINSVANNTLITFYRTRGNKVYNQAIPDSFLTLKQFTATIIFEGNKIGELSIYYSSPDEEKTSLQLSIQEQKWIESNTPIHYVYDPDWAPFEWTNDVGKYSGIISDFIRLLKADSGLNLVEIQTSSWSEATSLITERAADMYSAVGETKERKVHVNFSKNALLSTPYVFVSRKNKNFTAGFEPFKKINANLKLAVVDGYAIQSIMKKHLPDIPLVLLKGTEEGFEKLLSKEIDVFLVNKVTAKYFIHKQAYKSLKIAYKTKFKLELHVAIRNDWPAEVLSIIDKTIARFNENDLNRIHHKWTKTSKKVLQLDYETLQEEISNLSFIELLTLEEILFTAFIVLLFVYFIYQNYSKSKFLNINFSRFILLIVGFELFMLVFIVYELMVLDRIENSLADLYRDKLEMVTLVDQYRQNSDDLSHYARSYAATSKLEYRENYYAILTIKNGLSPRPKNYQGIYWDLGYELRKQLHPETENISLEALMAALPYSKEELDFLKQSEDNSNTLVELEAEAIKAVIEKQLTQALQLLYSNTYFQAKAMVMYPIDHMLSSINNRTDTTKHLLTQNISNAYRTIAIVCIIFFLGNFIIYLMLVKKIRQPLSYLINTLQEFKSGSRSIKEKIFYSDEIGVMNREFFSMRKVIQERMDAQIDAEEKTRLLLTSVGEGIYGVDSDGLVNFINPAALEMLQYSENEILGQNIHALIHHTYANGRVFPIEKCPMFHALKDGVISHIDNELLWRKDGSSFPVDYKARPIYKDNQLSGAVVAFNDTTERLQVKDQLISEIADRKKSELMAEQAKIRLENITNSIPGVVYQFQVIKGDITVKFISYGIKQLQNIEPKQLEGSFSRFVDSIHPDDQEYFLDTLNQSVNGLKPLDCDYRLLQSNGQIKWIHMEASVTQVCNEQKEVILNGNLVDVTEAKNAHELVVKQQFELQKIHKQTQESIEYAALIQGALIPDGKIFQTYFQDSFAIWQPKDIIGGDIYLMEQINQHEVILMVIDCTGHGVPGAFVSMLVKAIERLTVGLNRDRRVSPAKLLSVFNRNIKHLLKQEDDSSCSTFNAGFDGGILYYNKKHQFIRFASAKTPLFIIQNDELNIIKGNRHSVGYKKSDANYVFTDHQIDVSIPTQIYLTTDGYIDQNGGGKGFPFGKRRFAQLIMKHRHESLADQQEILLDELQCYQQNHERNDDITVVAIKI